MSPDDANVVARFLYLEMLKAGYTSVAEFHYLHHQANGQVYDNPAEMSHQVIAAAKDTGIAITHLPVLYTYAGFGEKAASPAQGRFTHNTPEFMQLLDSLFFDYKDDPLVKIGVAPHSLRAVSEKQLAELVPFVRSKNANAPVHIHIAEQMQEVNDCRNFYQKRPVEWLMDNYELDKNWCLIHATHLDESEVEKLSHSEAVVGICPTTEANLGDGIFPTQEFLARKGRIAIGSDSHIAVNVADELRTLEYAQRLIKQQRAVLANNECHSVGQNLYAQSAKYGADTVNQNVGEIAVGKRADFVVLDDSHPSLIGKQSAFVLDAAIFACPQMPVKDVMVAGKWQIQSGQHLQQEQIIQEYIQVMQKLV